MAASGAGVQLTTSQGADVAASEVPDRLGGSDRFETGANISAAFFDPGVERAYIATGFGFADALTGGVAANDAPLLLTTSESVTAATSADLDRLEPGEIVILSGTAAVGPSVETALADFTDGDVRRLAGSQRFATAAAISADHFDPADTRRAFVATGTDFADALAGGAAVSSGRGPGPGPLLLVTRDTVPDSGRQHLEGGPYRRLVLFGGPGAVSSETEQELRDHLDEG